MLPSTVATASALLRCARGALSVNSPAPSTLSRALQTTTLTDADDPSLSGSGGSRDGSGKKKLARLKLRSSRPSVAGLRSSSAPGASSSYPRVYTRTGDGGNSSLFTGERRNKDDLVFHALGATDELSSHIGLAMEYARERSHPYVDQLERVQCLLQDIGSALATPFSSARDVHLQKTSFNSRHTKELEEWIDEFSENLPPLQNFILPGGGLASASLHVCRAVCRRAERAICPLTQADEVDAEVLKYVNRLSDLLFTLARVAAKEDSKQETIYIRPTPGEPPYKSGPDGMWKKGKKD